MIISCVSCGCMARVPPDDEAPRDWVVLHTPVSICYMCEECHIAAINYFIRTMNAQHPKPKLVH